MIESEIHKDKEYILHSWEDFLKALNIKPTSSFTYHSIFSYKKEQYNKVCSKPHKIIDKLGESMYVIDTGYVVPINAFKSCYVQSLLTTRRTNVSNI